MEAVRLVVTWKCSQVKRHVMTDVYDNDQRTPFMKGCPEEGLRERHGIRDGALPGGALRFSILDFAQGEVAYTAGESCRLRLAG